jgi:beta-glucosidase
MDRPGLQLPGQQDALIQRVAAANPRTVVVLQTGGPVAMPWADDVAAIVQAWYPGQECGHAVADVLLGLAEPGGRLPQTFPRQLADDATQVSADTYPGREGRVHYSEGLFFGYRHHDRSGVAPLFPFGHGLSYTTLALLAARVDRQAEGWVVNVDLHNTGLRAGSEVVQLYVRDVACSVPRPDKELKAFAKLHLAPNERGRVSLRLSWRDLAFFDVARQAWVAEAGVFELRIGCSSVDIRHTLLIELAETWAAPL